MATPLSAKSLAKFKIAWEALGKERFEEILKEKIGYAEVWKIPEEQAQDVWEKVFLALPEIQLETGRST